MTLADIIKLAGEAGISIREHYDETGTTPEELQRFAKFIETAVYANEDMFSEAYAGGYSAGTVAEREQCARLVEPSRDHLQNPCDYLGGDEGVELLLAVAATIRARGKK